MALFKYIFTSATNRAVEFKAENLYDAEVAFNTRHHFWPRLLAEATDGSRRPVRAVYAFVINSEVIYIRSAVKDLFQAKALFEDRFGYRPRGGTLVQDYTASIAPRQRKTNARHSQAQADPQARAA